MTHAMGVWRQDLDARIFYAHLVRVCGDIENATLEAVACARAAPHNIKVRVTLAECFFDLALKSIADRAVTPTAGRKPPRGDGDRSGEVEGLRAGAGSRELDRERREPRPDSRA